MRYDHSPLHTAAFYGFVPRGDNKKDPLIKKDLEKKIKSKVHSLKRDDAGLHRGLQFDNTIEERVILTSQYLNKKFSAFPQPVMVYQPKAHGHLSLDVLGNPKSIADAMSIETAFAILGDEYKEGELILEINSLGDRESITRLSREVQNYYKKRWSEIPKDLKPVYKKDIWSLYDDKSKETEELRENSPKSMGCLSESSRKHLKEVLEYIETLNIPYIINHNLIASPSWMNETVMKICLVNENGVSTKVLACGGRYNSLAKKIFGKKDIPSFGIELVLNAPLKEGAKINFKLFFIQLSFDAKLKSLHVMELLRKANIPVYQSLSKDKLTSQISQAEKMKVPYILLMGKKEAIEDCVVVRDTTTRSQETIPIPALVAYLKKLL